MFFYLIFKLLDLHFKTADLNQRDSSQKFCVSFTNVQVCLFELRGINTTACSNNQSLL